MNLQNGNLTVQAYQEQLHSFQDRGVTLARFPRRRRIIL